MNRIVVSGLMLILISACSTTQLAPPINYYLLDTKPASPGQKLSSNLVQIKAVELPDYLEQPQLIIRENDHRLRIANYHSWADNLGDSIRRVLLSELNSLNQDFSFTNKCDQCRALRISIDHFYPTADGQVVLSGLFESVTVQGDRQVEQFLLSADLKTDGFDNSVSQMRELLSRLSAKIDKYFLIKS